MKGNVGSTNNISETDMHQGANVGELIGLLINGWVSERFG